jgi:2-polyprenyl-3-methyl-5-hydroxy-6-metoxy-1,4-benzoquinol methylase
MPTAAELARLYAQPHDHTRWTDHLYRVDVTLALAGVMLPRGGRVADLSCGNGYIAFRLAQTHGASVILGDFAPRYELTGPIEQTIEQIDRVDLFVCSETIEHLDDPDMVLARIREKTDQLILSTPDGETDTGNPEHVWGWDAEAVEKMLRDAGFTPNIHTTVDTRPSGAPYSFQIWACK